MLTVSGFSLLAVLQTAAATADPYEHGRALIESGDAEAALTYWIAVRDSVADANLEDPRISTAFIGAVAGENLERFEEIAASMFYWGFSGTVPTEASRDEIASEAFRTFILVDSAVALSLSRRAEEEPSAVALSIKRFWIERDPTPTTIANERLVEHWKRIAHSRREFTYNRSSPYQTDDRGILYVRYGAPDRVVSGHLGVNQSELRLLGLPFDLFAPYDVQPQYEIWRYGTLEERAFTYFLFGNLDGSGPFTRVQGLHEIIPREAKLASRQHQGIGIRYYMEFLYYADLADMGGPYARRLSELDRLWYGSRRPSEGVFQAASRRFIDDDNWTASLPLPSSLSDLDQAPKSALSSQVARILADSEPRLLVLATSSPLWKPTLDPDSGGIALSAYSASHTVIARDSGLRELVRANMFPVSDDDQVSVTALRHVGDIGHLSVTATHEIDDMRGSDGGDPPLPGQSHFSIAPPLAAPNADEIEVSDLVLGLPPGQVLAQTTDRLPVPLLPATRLWKDDLLRVYFEIYHPDPGVQTLDVTIRVVPKNGDIGWWTESSQPRFVDRGIPAVNVQLESEGPVGRHYIDLDLRHEGIGPMSVILGVTDPKTGATRLRAAPIQVLAF